MIQGFSDVRNNLDFEGNPTGGYVKGTGIEISWQDGPLGRGEDRLEPNGAFVEDVLVAALQRIEFYQTATEGRFHCPENTMAISHLITALFALEERTRAREEREVEGTHTP